METDLINLNHDIDAARGIPSKPQKQKLQNCDICGDQELHLVQGVCKPCRQCIGFWPEGKGNE